MLANKTTESKNEDHVCVIILGRSGVHHITKYLNMDIMDMRYHTLPPSHHHYVSNI